jgi:hypothetical protein
MPTTCHHNNAAHNRMNVKSADPVSARPFDVCCPVRAISMPATIALTTPVHASSLHTALLGTPH